MEAIHPDVVENSKGSKEGVSRVFSFSDLEMLENSTNQTWSLSKSLIDQVLEACGVSQEPVLNSSCHF